VKERFNDWQYPEFDATGMTKWNWICQHHDKLKLGKNVDIGAFTYINAFCGVEVGEDVQVGSHCAIYSQSTIDDKEGKVTLKRNARIGAHSLIMPGITVGENAVVGAFSFVNTDIPDNTVAYGVPARVISLHKLKG
jgi:acetyltransferase-like isoleucine patch superfamily enzyme